MAGLLDIPGFNTADFSISDEERKRLMLGNLLLGIGAGAMNARGNTIGALGSGALQGMHLGQQAVRDAQQGKMDQFRAASGMMDFAQKKQDYLDDQKARDVLQNFQQPAPLPSMSPTTDNAAALAAKPKAGMYEQLNAYADALQQNGLVKRAMQYRELAEKYKPEFSQTPQTGMDASGKPYQFVLDKNGNEKRLAAGVKPDFKSVDTGGEIGFYDPLTKMWGGQFGKTNTPDALLSSETARRGQNMVDARSREANAIAQQKPTWDGSAGQWIYPPSANVPSGAAVSPQGFDKPEKPLTESQAKATAFANQMANASREIAALDQEGFDGKGRIQQGRISVAGTEGIPYVPGSAAIPRLLAGGQAQRFQNAELQWTEGALRFMTGANAPEAEVRRNADTFFPRPGDSEEKVAQKAQARRNMEESVRLAAGGGNKQIPPMPSNLVKNTTATVKAREAIKRGADPAAVRARLRENGYSDDGL